MSWQNSDKPRGFRPRASATTRITIIAILSVLLIFLILSARLLAVRTGTFDVLPGLHLGHDTKGASAAAPPENRFILHPYEHIFRAPATIRDSWQITTGMRRPDGVLKQIYLINGAFPGPTIETRSGDRLIIRVENRLGNGEGLSIHWHGLSMRGANNMDGAAGVTQATIKDGDSMTMCVFESRQE